MSPRGLLYRPSNGTEGEWFYGAFCAHCIRESASRTENADPGDGCDILAATYAFGISDPNYPREWRYVDGKPVCTAFRWDPEDEALDPRAVVRALL